MRAILFFLLMTGFLGVNAQSFLNDVKTIRDYDRLFPPPGNPVVFTGSSSVRMWPNLQKAFPERNVLNRGIGGAVVNDIIYFLDDLVFKYNPSQVVIYVGDNDMVDGKSTADSILNRVKRLYTLIRKKLPDVPVDYLAIKPSPSRSQYLPMAKQANKMISEYLKTEKNARFIDVYSPMVDRNGEPREELFREDRLHMNEKGYAIWEKATKPYLQALE